MISLHQHQFLFPLLAHELHALLKGFVCKQVWAKDKTELNFVFQKDAESLSFQLNIETNCGLFFFYEYALERPGGVVPMFQILENKEILAVQHHPGNRSFQLEFKDNLIVLFKLYGPLTNVLLFQENKVIKLFRGGIENDWHQTLDNLSVQNYTQSNNFKGDYFIGFNQNSTEPILSFEEPAQVLVRTENLAFALNEFSSRFIQYHLFESAKQKLLSTYKQKIKREQGQILGAQKYLKHIEESVPPDEIGHILMANLHLIKKGEINVSLFDFYRNQPIEIPLKKDLSPQDNAANYYKKAKNRSKEIAQKQEQLQKNTEMLARSMEVYQTLEKATTLKDLRPWLKEEKQKFDVPLREKFRHFEFSGFHVYVGKSAANNDVLTLKFAHKEDAWLHAKGVSGSHVIIKHKPKEPFPASVIQFAAAIAAHYSSAAGASLVPVIVTTKKFVRKPKGANAGQVAVEREELVMVEPGIPAH